MRSERLIRSAELRRMLGDCSPATINRWMARGILPRPIALPGVATRPRWRLSDIEAFMAGKEKTDAR